MDDGTPPPNNTGPPRPTKRTNAPKSTAGRSGTSKSATAKGTGSTVSKSAAPRTAGNRSSGSKSKSKSAATDPRRESIDTAGASRRAASGAVVIDPLLSQPVPVVLADVPPDVLPDVLADVLPDVVPDVPLPIDSVSHADTVGRAPIAVPDDVTESGRIELPAIVPADIDPELEADTEASFAIDPPTEPVALVERVPRIVVVPSGPIDEPVAPLPSEWIDTDDTEGTDDTDGLPSMARPARSARRLRAPVVMRRGRRPRVRRVTRVIRQVDTWSVFKVSLVFSLFLYGVVITAGVLLWKVAQNTGTVDNVQRFFESFGWKSFTLHGGAIFHQAWVAGLFGVVGLTGFSVLVATLFNLITDLVGGIRVTVLEEEVIAREERGLGWRRASRAAARAEVATAEVAAASEGDTDTDTGAIDG